MKASRDSKGCARKKKVNVTRDPLVSETGSQAARSIDSCRLESYIDPFIAASIGEWLGALVLRVA